MGVEAPILRRQEGPGHEGRQLLQPHGRAVARAAGADDGALTVQEGDAGRTVDAPQLFRPGHLRQAREHEAPHKEARQEPQQQDREHARPPPAPGARLRGGPPGRRGRRGSGRRTGPASPARRLCGGEGGAGGFTTSYLARLALSGARAAQYDRETLLGGEAALADEPCRVGEPVRRLRPLLSRAFRGRGDGRGDPHARRLQAPGRRDLSLPRLRQPQAVCARLHQADAQESRRAEVDAQELRLPPPLRRPRPGGVAPPDQRRPRQRSSAPASAWPA